MEGSTRGADVELATSIATDVTLCYVRYTPAVSRATKQRSKPTRRPEINDVVKQKKPPSSEGKALNQGLGRNAPLWDDLINFTTLC